MFYFLCKTIRNGRYAKATPLPIYKLGFLQPPSLSLKYNISSTSDQQPFTVSYLINALGLSPKVAVSASRYVSFETPERADFVINFFKSLAFSETQISKLVRRLPTVLLSDTNRTLLPKIEFLASKGISRRDLAKMLSGCPHLLKRSLAKQIIPSFDFFKDLLQSEDKTVQAIIRFPGMLAFDLETYVAPNINTLRENGVPECHILTLLKYNPRSLIVNPVRFREILEEVKEMGFNPLRLNFAIAVVAFRAMRKSTWESKVDVYKKWGWSEDEVFVAFKRHPWCMMASKDKIMGAMDFFVNKMSLDPSVVFKRPALVSLSLEKRLIPRGLVVQVLFAKGLVKKDISMTSLFECPDETFLRKFVMPHKEEASELLKLYKEDIRSLEMKR
ncbi:transcription termination factor MTERF6, chloroplastic/mitochondrial-like [Juglans microcarpa x Juglans regia]|uniref:transcription termination factor MTERF6, chloroplastic/mitochondrial-like n=1 Tax=Juglans microcarpa x Juglans regia TaxID=2249226 RepID=UPI001B7EEF39|nr:transcription termination factor MTERF6, chloroplastic/mitochondrial-like [Juglans microcarpa x Juglans regia]